MRLAPSTIAASLPEVGDAAPEWSAVLDTLLFRAGFNTAVVVAGTTLLGLAAGVVGLLALLRKRSLMADALGHATLPGIAIVFLAASALGAAGRSMPLLLAGAAATGIAGMLAVQAILRFTRLREDAAIAIVLSVSFAIGVVLLSIVQTTAPAGAAGIHHLIYGQTAAMRAADAIAMGSIAVLSLLAARLFLKEFALVAFDEPFARSEGWPIGGVDLAMMSLVVVVTVVGLQAVGLILVVAMLIIPAAAARFWTERLSTLLWLSAGFGAAGGYLGAVVSALLPRKPAGAVIVLVAGSIFVVSILVAPSRGLLAAAARRARLRLRIAAEHVLESTFEHWRRDRRSPIVD
ncbi:MAG: metal ABC transporter permease, partial [Phycisphaerales bacterium]